MRLIVEAVSKTSKGILAGGQWYNRGKGAKFTNFDSLRRPKGQTVEIEAFADGTWITDFVAMGNEEAQQESATESAPQTSKAPTLPASSSAVVLARQSATQAVLGSPVVAEMLKSLDRSEATAESKKLIAQMTNYVLTGNFQVEEKKPDESYT